MGFFFPLELFLLVLLNFWVFFSSVSLVRTIKKAKFSENRSISVDDLFLLQNITRAGGYGRGIVSIAVFVFWLTGNYHLGEELSALREDRSWWIACFVWLWISWEAKTVVVFHTASKKLRLRVD